MTTEKNINDVLYVAERWGIDISRDDAISCFKLFMVSSAYINSTLQDYVFRTFRYRKEIEND